MSDHELHLGSDPSDLRHDVTGLDKRAAERVLQAGDHIGNDTQAPVVPRNPWHDDPEGFVPIEKFDERPPIAYPPVASSRRTEFYSDVRPPSQQRGLQWHSGDGAVRSNLAAFPWEVNRRNGVETSNVELRTIHAHLMEAIALARNEMRERGMVVDF